MDPSLLAITPSIVYASAARGPVLQRGLHLAVTEYKKFAEELDRRGVLAPDSAHQLRVLAGYRNRMVHFYHDVTEEELYSICIRQIADVLAVRDAYVSWLRNHPECIDNAL